MTARSRNLPTRPVKGTQIHSVYKALSELPGVPITSQELADETGLSIKFCSGYIYTLHNMGLAFSRPKRDGRRGATYEHWAGELL